MLGFLKLVMRKKKRMRLFVYQGEKLTRVPESIRLWSEGYGRELFLTEEKSSNAKFSHLDVSNLDFAKAVSSEIKKNINWKILPSQDGGATSTFDEAEDALKYAKENDWERLIIVTDHFHTRRAFCAFEKVFKDSGIQVQVAGADNDIFNATNWWKSDRGILTYFSETIKYPIYLLWGAEPEVVSNH
jgi:uncharacterized SAM-binding protein YcdF (DUF218 family)